MTVEFDLSEYLSEHDVLSIFDLDEEVMSDVITKAIYEHQDQVPVPDVKTLDMRAEVCMEGDDWIEDIFVHFSDNKIEVTYSWMANWPCDDFCRDDTDYETFPYKLTNNTLICEFLDIEVRSTFEEF